MNEYVWYNELSRQFMNKGYLEKGQEMPARVRLICETAERILGIKGYADKLEEYFKRGWYSFSTPIWCNFGNQRGLGISCFGSWIADDMSSILDAVAEVGMMTKHGGGTSGYVGALRPRGAAIRSGANGTSSGPVHFCQLFETLITTVSQGSTRRGNFAAYIDIDHPDIMEFLQMRSEGNVIQNLSFGVNVPDYWMEEMVAGDRKKREVWAKILDTRARIGFPYILFIDTVNRNTVDVYRSKGMRIHHSNLCSEIALPNNDQESFVCDLSSMNILRYDEWKDTDAVEVMVQLLDAVMTEFIQKGKGIKYMERAVRFAENHRALGIGWFGWHSYLQSKMIPFESMQAKLLNSQIAQNIQEAAWEASKKMAVTHGMSDLMKEHGRRHSTLTAIAPTKSSSFIIGQASEGIEPIDSNYYIKDLQKGKFSIRNPYLEMLLEKRGLNNDEIWMSILKKAGSVQHLDCLSEDEKAVFKTFSEISPKEVVIQAAQRQKYIDQSQSLNLMIHPSIPAKDVNALMIEAWKMGVKSLYYQHSVNAAQEFSRNILTCQSCEG